MVSVIIPVYNVEKFLVCCIESVLIQSYEDFEILLIDDGSTDSSGELCDKMILKDKRIKVFHKSNGGVSSARNYGMDQALGEYIIFLDSDDYWIERDALARLVNEADKKNLDVVRGEFVNVCESGEITYIPNIDERKKNLQHNVFASYEMVKYVINGNYFFFFFLIRRSSLDGLRFDEERKFQEDMDFLAKFFCTNFRCGYIALRFYGYRQRGNSISTLKITNLKDSFALCDVFKFYSNKVEDKRLKEVYQYFSIKMYCSTLNTVAEFYMPQYKTIIKNFSLVNLRIRVRDLARHVRCFYCPFQIYVSPYWGVFIYYLYLKFKFIVYKIRSLFVIIY